eukprot:1140529-Pelagomonas_calceolata.AAC.1
MSALGEHPKCYTPTTSAKTLQITSADVDDVCLDVYVGELSLLLPSKRVARFSVLDFWGNREASREAPRCEKGGNCIGKGALPTSIQEKGQGGAQTM